MQILWLARMKLLTKLYSNAYKQTDVSQWSTDYSYEDLATMIFVYTNECWPLCPDSF